MFEIAKKYVLSLLLENEEVKKFYHCCHEVDSLLVSQRRPIG